MTTADPKNSRHAMPFTRIEVVTFSIIDKSLHVLLGRRKAAPHAGKWALPGGVLRTDLDNSLEGAVDRVISERLQTELPLKRQLCTVGGPARDPRGWSISLVYWALLPIQTLKAVAGKRMEALRWAPVEEAVQDAALAFDHAQLIDRAVKELRQSIDSLDLPVEFLPSHFTLGELQETCEILLGRSLDKSSFRRRLAAHDLLVAVEGERKLGAFRPAQVYRARITR